MKARIVERTGVNGKVSFVIQQRHFLFRWIWVDAWVNGSASTRDTFSTLKEAEANLCYFDGTEVKEKVCHTST